MQFAAVLSDLTSLRACEHSAALALVNVPKTVGELRDGDISNDEDNGKTDTADQRADTNENSDARPELQRVKDLLDLHREVKSKHHHYYDAGGLNEELSRIRQDVSRVQGDLEQQRDTGSSRT